MGRGLARRGGRKGDFLAGKYLLEDCLGIGGMGEVYRATNVALGRKVAIKLLSAEYVHIEDDVLRFLREARAAAAIRHSNVVDVLDVARDDDGTPFIVQELLAGEDLERYLRARQRVSWEEALEIMIPVADAVAAAHAESVVHRDLKPANIFLARDRNRIIPKVLDFGACLFPTLAERSAKEARMLIGTPHYMAPEQIVSKAEVDARSDVWALGVILFEMMVGETPFEAETANAVMQLVKTRDVPPLQTYAKDAPTKLAALVARCTARDRLARPADARAVHEELEEIRRTVRGLPSSRVPTLAEEATPPAPASEAPPPPTGRIPSLDQLPRPKLPSLDVIPAATSSRPPARKTFDDPARVPDALGPRELEPELESAPALALAARPTSWPPRALEERASRPGSSLPPVLDPRAARRIPSTPPPPSTRRAPASAAAPRVGESGSEAASTRAPTPRWTATESTKLVATLTVPVVLGVTAVLGIPTLALPLGRALRGESTVASGVLAVAALAAAAVLCGRCMLGEASRAVYAATAGAVLFGVVMIIVTFSASEAAELGVPPATAGLSTLVGPLAPLAAALGALRRARAQWLDPFARAEAIRSAAIASSMLVLAIALSPLGAARSAAHARSEVSTPGV